MSTCTIKKDKIEGGVSALFKVLNGENEQSSKKKLLDASSSIFLQIDFVKVPKVQKRIIRIPLKHTLVNETSEVCLFVADLIRGQKVNHEVTVNHYNKLLKKRGVTDVQKIDVIPSRRVRVDFSSYEAKRKLCNMYDFFLIDNKISSYLRPKLGQAFYKTRKWPVPIRIKRKDLKDEIISKLKKTSIVLDGNGVTKTIQIGSTEMSTEEITENVLSVCEFISKKFPGGWKNIRSLHIKEAKSASVPIYMSLISRNDVPTPVLKNKKRKLRFTDELSTIRKKVTVYPSGRVKVHKEVSDSETSDDENDEEIIKAAKENEKQKKKVQNEQPADKPQKTKKKVKNTEDNDDNDGDEEEEENYTDKFEDGESKYLFQFMMEQSEKEKEEKKKRKSEQKEEKKEEKPTKQKRRKTGAK